MDAIVNKVAESGIITLDLANFLPKEENIIGFDLKPFLFKEMILREKDYRTTMAEHDWSIYNDKNVAIYCSVDAIIPMWAYMLATSYLQQNDAKLAYYGSEAELKNHVLLQNISDINIAEYENKRVILKGCGDVGIPEKAYVAASQKLLPVVKTLMYGEPCSTVPIYKKPKPATK